MNKKVFLPIAFFLIVMVVFSSFQTQQDHKVLFEKAKYTMETKADLKEAINLFESLIKTYPNEKEYVAKSLLYQGMCYEKLGNQEAAKKYQRVIDNFSSQKNEVALAKDRLDYLSAAKEGLKMQAEQHLKKGNELFSLWEYESAIEEYKKAIEPDPNSLLALNAQYCIGQTLFRQGKNESALETFKKLVEKNPESNIAPVTELMISQVEHEMNEKKPIKKISANEEKGTVLDSETGIEFRRIKTFTGNSDVIKWVPSTQLSPNGKFLLSDKTIVPMDGTPPFTFTDLNLDDSEWSPDGTKIAFRSDSSIYIMNIVSETAEKIEPVKKIFSEKCEIYGINWALNSEILYFSLLNESKKDYPEIYALNTSNGTIKQITNESIPLVAPGCSPDGRMLACTSIHSDLWLCPMDGGNAKQISDGSSVKYTGPIWTPDGKWIFSDETRKGWGRSLNFIRIEDENEVKLTPPAQTGTWLSFNSQKDKMLFCKSSYRIFWGMKIASSAGGPSYEPAPHLPVYGAQWSNDSKMIIVQGEKNNNMEDGDAAIRIVPISGGESFLLNMDVNVNGKPFAYGVTPNQKRILFVTKKDGDVTDDFYMAPISIEEGRVTGPPTMIIEKWNRNGAHNTKMSMSQDGTKLAIINNEDIWIYDLNKKNLKQITNTPEKKKWVAWSPDGSMISYQYLHNQPKFKKGSCIISSTDGKQIKKIEDHLLWPYGWPPDSKSIVYEQDGKIVNHNLATDVINVLVEPKSLGLKWIAQYFWSPDGKSMLLDARKENEPDKYFLYKYSMDGKLTEIADDDTSYKYDISWSPDGKWICYCYYEVEKYLPESTLWEADFEEVKEKLLEMN